jgi:hypothetical protein
VQKAIHQRLDEFLSRENCSTFSQCFPSTSLPKPKLVLGLKKIDKELFQKLFRSLIRAFRSFLAKSVVLAKNLPKSVTSRLSRHINWLIDSSTRPQAPPSRKASHPSQPPRPSPVFTVDDAPLEDVVFRSLGRSRRHSRRAASKKVENYVSSNLSKVESCDVETLSPTVPFLERHFVRSTSSPLPPVVPSPPQVDTLPAPPPPKDSDPVEDRRSFSDFWRPIRVRAEYAFSQGRPFWLTSDQLDELHSTRFFTNLGVAPPRLNLPVGLDRLEVPPRCQSKFCKPFSPCRACVVRRAFDGVSHLLSDSVFLSS